jgi:hypothetical protein
MTTTPIRVGLVGTGNAGRLALRHLIEDERFELVAVGVSTPEKVGVDAGTLAGREGADAVTGVAATAGLDGVIAAAPDCVVYTAMGDTRLFEAMEDCRRILDAGIHVVGTSPGTLLFPWGTLPVELFSGLEDAARERGVSMFVSGVDPGFASDLLPIALASTCRHVTAVRCYEIADYATYDGAEVMFDVMGFARPLDEVPLLFKPGILSAAWGPAIRIMAEAFGVEIDEITEAVDRAPATEAYDVAVGRVEVGTQEAVRFEIVGRRAGEPLITIEHVTRLREGAGPDWRQPPAPGGGYRVEIDGEPSYGVDVVPTSAEGDHNHAAILLGVGRVVNAIPATVAAEPGLRTTLDLPISPGRFLPAG